MKGAVNKLVNSVLKKSSFEECSVEELEMLTKKYPYFITGHFLLAKKLMQSDPVAEQPHFKHSSIYFNKPLWIDFKLREKDSIPEVTPEQSREIKMELTAEQEDDFTNDEYVYSNHKHEMITPSITPAETKRTHEKHFPSENVPLKATEEISFEPFHTVDYFASQGIKTVLEEKPADRFGQQVKSFTEWLKALKKLPESEIGKFINTASEEKVVSMAEHSIENREVVTESMAEIWIKQGQPEKAIEIYNKLSLLNPSKSAYFAGLIENLKK